MISLRASSAKTSATVYKKSHRRLQRGKSLRIIGILRRACDHTSRYLGVAVISGYQKFISPHKGFRCAHRVLYGGESCSAYIKRIAAEEGIIPALRSLKPRFAECRCAYETIKEIKARHQESPQSYTSQRISFDHAGYALAINHDSVNLSDNNTEPSPGIANNSPETSELPQVPPETDPKKASEPTANETNCMDCTDFGECAGETCASGGCDAIGSTVSDSCSAVSCDSLNCGALDCSALDCGALDCGALDCGALDCSGLDCGSCG